MERKNKIQQFMHCSKCLEELDRLQREDEEKYLPISPRMFADIEVGFTKKGFQIHLNWNSLMVSFPLSGSILRTPAAASASPSVLPATTLAAGSPPSSVFCFSNSATEEENVCMQAEIAAYLRSRLTQALINPVKTIKANQRL